MSADKCPACGANPIECGCERETPDHASPGRRRVFLFSADGKPAFFFDTDRQNFPETATWDRDRVFRLAFTGELARLDGSNISGEGAIYVESEPWRITTRSIDLPKANSRRRRRSAEIIQFPSIQAALDRFPRKM